jgi:hypothetical protein
LGYDSRAGVGRYSGMMPSDLVSVYGILDSLTGDHTATEDMLRDRRWPGATLAMPDPQRYPARPMLLAQAVTGTMSDVGGGFGVARFPPIGDVTVERLAGGGLRLGEFEITAAMLLQQIDQQRERIAVADAIARFGLDRTQAADVLAARAYVWADWMAPISFPAMPWSGPEHDRAAEAVMGYEREHPGTTGLATRGNAAAIAAISTLIGETTSGVLDNPDVVYSVRPSAVDKALDANATVARSLCGNPSYQSWQAHHLVPFAVMASLPVLVQQAIAASGWKMDSVENLIALPANYASFVGFPNLQSLPQHSGSHVVYDADVRVALVPIVAGANSMGAQALRSALMAVESLQRDRLIQRRYHPRVH